MGRPIGTKVQSCSSAYLGVTWAARNQKWRVAVWNKAHDHLLTGGYFEDETDAAHKADDLFRQERGSRARLNFPLPGELSIKTDRKTGLHLKVSKGLRERVRTQAARQDCCMAEVIREAIQQYLETSNKENK